MEAAAAPAPAAAAVAAAPSLPCGAGGRRAVAAAAAEAEYGSGGPRTPGPWFPVRLQARSLGQPGSCEPSASQAPSLGRSRPPCLGIMGNGMTKVGETPAAPGRPRPAAGPWTGR